MAAKAPPIDDWPAAPFWAAVLLRVIKDAHEQLPREHIRSRNTSRLEIDRARAYLTGNGRDFRMICEWAGLDADCVTAKTRSWAAAGWPGRLSRYTNQIEQMEAAA